MKVAHFNIEEKLHWLLPQDKRRDNFDYPFNGPQTVKHLVESVGVPHTETGKIRANGERVGLSYLVRDGERIEIRAVEPAGESTVEPRFVIDGHLGRCTQEFKHEDFAYCDLQIGIRYVRVIGILLVLNGSRDRG